MEFKIKMKTIEGVRFYVPCVKKGLFKWNKLGHWWGNKITSKEFNGYTDYRIIINNISSNRGRLTRQEAEDDISRAKNQKEIHKLGYYPIDAYFPN
jgi:hypothetical protein